MPNGAKKLLNKPYTLPFVHDKKLFPRLQFESVFEAERREYTCKYVNDICILAGTRHYNIYVHRLGKPMKK